MLFGAKIDLTFIIFGVEKNRKNLQKGLLVKILYMGKSKGEGGPYPIDPTVDPPLRKYI